MPAATNEILFTAHANAQMDLLNSTEKREVLSQLRSLEFDGLGPAKTGERGDHKIIAGRFTVVYRIRNGEVNVITLAARE